MNPCTSILSNIFYYFSFCVALSIFTYKLLRFFNDIFTKERKESISLWLWGCYEESTWVEHFCDFFDAIFGKNHFRPKCIFFSALFSLVSVVIFYVLFGFCFDILGEEKRSAGNLSFLQILKYGFLINFVADYISLLETRWLLHKFRAIRSFWAISAMLVLDIIITSTIIWLAINTYHWYKGYETISIIKMLAAYSIFSIFFYSTFITSLWAWLYCISTWIMRLFSRTWLKDNVDIQEKPIELIAIISAIIIFLSTILLYPLISTDHEGEITPFDKFWCKVNLKVCKDVARSSNDAEVVLKYLARSCDGSETQKCFEEALKYYGNNKEKPLDLFENACKKGNTSACVNLGVMYRKGLGVAQDPSMAYTLYQKACDDSDMKGCDNLAGLYALGKGVTRNVKTAFQWYIRACDNGDGNIQSCTNLGHMYENGLGIHVNLVESYNWYGLSCKRGNMLGCYNLGTLYIKGKGVAQDFYQAIKYFKQACDGGLMIGCHGLGNMYRAGQGLVVDLNEARTFYEKACNGGEMRGCYNLGSIYLEEFGDISNRDKAQEFFDKACTGGNMMGCNNLASIYGEDSNLDKELEFYKKACEGGNILSCRNLGTIYLHREDLLFDRSKALEFYKKACDGGEMLSCNIVKNIY